VNPGGNGPETDPLLVEWRPSPDIGGSDIDEACVLILGQNPNNDVTGEYNGPKFRVGDDMTPMEQLMWHREGLKHSFTPSKVVEAMGLDWRNVVWDNPVKCPTEDNTVPDILFLNCVDEWLSDQIKALDPDFIVGMGKTAQRALNRTFNSVDLGWGDTDTTVTGIGVHSMYHYGYLMRNNDFGDEMQTFRSDVLPQIPTEAWS
jgi:hypothetical protein